MGVFSNKPSADNCIETLSKLNKSYPPWRILISSSRYSQLKDSLERQTLTAILKRRHFGGMRQSHPGIAQPASQGSECPSWHELGMQTALQGQPKITTVPSDLSGSASEPSRTNNDLRFSDLHHDPEVELDSACDELDAFLLKVITQRFRNDTEAYKAASLLPPITRQSLSELDIGAIINNSKLRHDINYDRELHFRPNMDGERGKRKKAAQVHYWKAITVELRLVFFILRSSLEESLKSALIQRASRRLREMFITIGDILKSLVPERDQAYVDEHLDIDMLMQKVCHGVCDFVSLAIWMAQLIKRHCAPMRDGRVDSMVAKVKLETPESVAAGLTDLFTVLEEMKLDVANHQIRHLRPLLIEDTINFEQKYHCSRMKRHRCNRLAARKWYLRIRDLYTHERPETDIEVFATGFLQLLLPTVEVPPDTFMLDSFRIKQLKDDMDELIRDPICCDVLHEVASMVGAHISTEQEAEFQSRLLDMAGGPRVSNWHLHATDLIACEIVRCVLNASGSREVTDEFIVDKATDLLLNRLWATHNAKVDAKPEPEMKALRQQVEVHIKNAYTSLLPLVLRTVKDNLNNSPFDIFSALVPSQGPTHLSPVPHSSRWTKHRHHDLVRRIAHTIILHWRVWEELVYTNEELDDEIDGDAGTLTKLPTQAEHEITEAHDFHILTPELVQTDRTIPENEGSLPGTWAGGVSGV